MAHKNRVLRMMHQHLIQALTAVPEKRLALLEMSWKVLDKDGQLDEKKIREIFQELEQAAAEARDYMKQVEKAIWFIQALLKA
jgi:hypothetical protein